mgnify:CR=1 FL=1
MNTEFVSILEKIITFVVAILLSWGIMRERVLKVEIKLEYLQNEALTLKASHKELEERINVRLDEINKLLNDILISISQLKRESMDALDRRKI